MQTQTLAIKNTNYTIVVPHYSEATIVRTNAAVQTTHPFGNDRQSKAYDCIQKQKIASKKKKKNHGSYSNTKQDGIL